MLGKAWYIIKKFFPIKKGRDIFDVLQLLAMIAVPTSIYYYTNENIKAEKEQALKRERLEQKNTLRHAVLELSLIHI